MLTSIKYYTDETDEQFYQYLILVNIFIRKCDILLGCPDLWQFVTEDGLKIDTNSVTYFMDGPRSIRDCFVQFNNLKTNERIYNN